MIISGAKIWYTRPLLLILQRNRARHNVPVHPLLKHHAVLGLHAADDLLLTRNARPQHGVESGPRSVRGLRGRLRQGRAADDAGGALRGGTVITKGVCVEEEWVNKCTGC